MRRRLLAVLAPAALLLAGCGDDGGGDQGGGDPDDGGCLVAPADVGAALGYDVELDDEATTDSSCRYVPAATAGDRPGSFVLVVERQLADGPEDEEGYDAVLAGVESEVGPARALEDGQVDGADRGWIATLGRVVQVGAAVGDRLVQVTVADGALDAPAARAAALDIANDAR